jgi:hypothetical protein
LLARNCRLRADAPDSNRHAETHRAEAPTTKRGVIPALSPLQNAMKSGYRN